ncbi:putative All-trans-retinol 13,14-reductase [uncultured Desulfobacterium sp.]|uniref:Putative All-trans-retinol 13,14-reductase n=1 Tax=uncultured Desulfobacterium sp. TaxID=201089 RepID=A0A445N1T0_9BACT|nr:putative All-trans-retinol 13,14-reductase [uncultured Desulfobacterium sp.]
MDQRLSPHFDTIIIGAGLAGLTCAALLAKAGLRVAVLEKNSRLGGYAVSYAIKGHRFDIAVQAIGGCDTDGVISRLFKELGHENRIRFLPCEPARVYYFGNDSHPWEQSGLTPKLIDSLSARFPEYHSAITRCYETWSGILRELEEIAQRGSDGVAFGFSRSYPMLSRYSAYTVKEFFDQLAIPEALRSLMTSRSGYCMLPTERLSLVGFACTEMTYGKGAWMVEGGIEKIPGLLAKSVYESGGMIMRRARMVRIYTKDGAVDGVETIKGDQLSSNCVVIASSLKSGLFLDRPQMIPDRFTRRVALMEPSGSYYIAYYSIPEPAARGLHHNMEFTGLKIKHPLAFSTDAFYMLVPSLIDPSAAPPGRHCLCLSLPCPAGYSLAKDERNACRMFLEESVIDRFPMLKGKMQFFFDLGPRQLETISGNPGGSAYGWVQTPEQSGIRRLGMKTPISGLYLTGHWTMPGGGIAGVITSGRLCARMILKDY